MTQLQVFQCPACGANLSFDGGTETTLICEYCQARVIVPEQLRSHAGPALQPENTQPYVPIALPGGAVLSGPALTVAVVFWLINQASAQTGMKIDKDPLASARIGKAADKAMRELKTQPAATISLPFLTADSNGPKNFQIELTRAAVDEVARGASTRLQPPPAKAKKKFRVLANKT